MHGSPALPRRVGDGATRWRARPRSRAVSRQRGHGRSDRLSVPATERVDSLAPARARGEADADSDVDLLIVLPGGTDRRAAAIAIRRALEDMPAAKDIVVSTPEEIARRGDIVGSILKPALREGRVLYERS
ncbi:nucleotidyltransferase domain-containing protein [Candidatus Poribacteria bacterium]|nr:nucleotidyltransferase domain-containing protein [Candidatus Poribacteria bacterium]